MPGNAASNPSPLETHERRVAIFAIVGPLVFGAGLCALLIAMNSRDNSPTVGMGYSVISPAARLIAPDRPRHLVDFTLIDRTGRTVTRSDLDGKILVVNFLFTSCSLTCPAVSRTIAQIQRLTTNQPDVMLVSLTVDPRDDTPAVLEKYGGRFGADTNRWLFLTGAKSELYHLIQSSFLSEDLNDPLGYMPGNFSHTERIAVVDAHGRLHGYFDGLYRGAPAAVVNEITKLRSQPF